MKNYDTFNISNVFDIDNWIIVGKAMALLAYNFWPVLAFIAAWAIIEHRKEKKHAARID